MSLRDRLEAEQDIGGAAEVALKLAFAADQRATLSEAVSAARSAHRLIALFRAGMMRSWDWMLLAMLSGIAAKHHIHEGRLGLAAERQAEAWSAVCSGVRHETGLNWQKGQALPPGISGEMLSIIVRYSRYDGELLSLAGRSVEAVFRMRELDGELMRTGRCGGAYGDQLLGFLTSEQNFLVSGVKPPPCRSA